MGLTAHHAKGGCVQGMGLRFHGKVQFRGWEWNACPTSCSFYPRGVSFPDGSGGLHAQTSEDS